MSDIPKKTGVIILLVAITIAFVFTFGILSYFQTARVVEVGAKESDSGRAITLTVEKPPVVDEIAGSVSLTFLPPRGEG